MSWANLLVELKIIGYVVLANVVQSLGERYLKPKKNTGLN
jgi:hypothetical protein